MAVVEEESSQKLLNVANTENNEESPITVNTSKIRLTDDNAAPAANDDDDEGDNVDSEKKLRRSLRDRNAGKDEGQLFLGDGNCNSSVQTRLYRTRWIVLCSVALLNFSNTFLWIVFAAVANHVNVFYGYSQAANWFSLVFILCTIPVGFLAMWLGSKFGLRSALLIAAWLNAGGTLFRFASSFLPFGIRFPVGIFGQGISACAYPFIMFLPTKVAGSWFAENERTLATTIGVMANPFGVFLANLLSPLIVASPSDVPFLNGLILVPTMISALLTTVGVRRSKPKLPPTVSASEKQMDFMQGMKSCVENKSFLVLAITLGGGIGMFNCLYTVIQQLLCPVGYVNAFSGACASTMIVGGVIGAFVAGIFVDFTKAFEETLKVSFALAVLCGLAFLQLTLHVGHHYMVILSCFFFGIFGLAAYPVGLQISAECTFPVPENVSTGLIVIFGQVQSILYVALISFTAKELQSHLIPIQTCTATEGDNDLSSAKDNTVSVIVVSLVAAILVCMLFLLFHPEMKRMEAEKVKKSANDNNNLPDDKQIPLKDLKSS